ncbi:MAG: AMP-binding protein [Trebonia sp.]
MRLDSGLTSKEMVMFNLARSLDRNADRAPHEDAVIYRETRLTHLQLLDRVNALAAAFLASGVGRGDIVALLMGNRPEFLESALAVNRVGAAFLPLNVRLAEPELEYIIRHAGAAAIVTESGFAAPAAAIGGRLAAPWTVVMAGGTRARPQTAPGTSHSSVRVGAPPFLLPMSARRTCTG